MSTQQQHARRIEKAAAKAQLREVDPEDFGECALCGFTHNRPLERTVCPVCGGTVCFGEPMCGCGSSSEVSGKLRDATEKAGDALAGVPARGDIFTPTTRRS